jgi:hypothetical protein
LLEFADELEKAKTSTPLMFLKGFGYDQCEVDATEGSNPFRIDTILRINTSLNLIIIP